MYMPVAVLSNAKMHDQLLESAGEHVFFLVGYVVLLYFRFCVRVCVVVFVFVQGNNHS